MTGLGPETPGPGRRDQPGPATLEEGIRFEHVSFSYPGQQTPVLQDVCLTLRAGTTVAVVGENGVGKSTLIKLLTGMYYPTAGQIMVDGQDLADISPASWREVTTGAFQDFVRFAMSLGDGVGARPAEGTITVLVSDRFGTVHMADQIIVLDHGRVAESGDHQDLVSRGGVYAELFALQAAGYQP